MPKKRTMNSMITSRMVLVDDVEDDGGALGLNGRLRVGRKRCGLDSLAPHELCYEVAGCDVFEVIHVAGPFDWSY